MSNKSLVRLRITLYSSWALFNAWCTGMAGTIWADMGWESKSVLIGSILMNWTGVLVAYFDKSAWRLDEENRMKGS